MKMACSDPGAPFLVPGSKIRLPYFENSSPGKLAGLPRLLLLNLSQDAVSTRMQSKQVPKIYISTFLVLLGAVGIIGT